MLTEYLCKNSVAGGLYSEVGEGQILLFQTWLQLNHCSVFSGGICYLWIKTEMSQENKKQNQESRQFTGLPQNPIWPLQPPCEEDMAAFEFRCRISDTRQTLKIFLSGRVSKVLWQNRVQKGRLSTEDSTAGVWLGKVQKPSPGFFPPLNCLLYFLFAFFISKIMNKTNLKSKIMLC